MCVRWDRGTNNIWCKRCSSGGHAGGGNKQARPSGLFSLKLLWDQTSSMSCLRASATGLQCAHRIQRLEADLARTAEQLAVAESEADAQQVRQMQLLAEAHVHCMCSSLERTGRTSVLALAPQIG